jgi:hypothetical protein
VGDKLDKTRSLNGRIESLDADLVQVRQELEILQHIDDDAQRDAAVSENYDDRAAARMTQSDVARMEKHLRDLDRARAKLVAKRDRLIRKLVAK